MIKSFEEMTTRLVASSCRQTAIVVCPYDASTANAVARAVDQGFVKAILVGETAKMPSHLVGLSRAGEGCSIVESEGFEEAAEAAVKIAKRGEGDILVKGLINTDLLLKAVLNKQHGLLLPGSVLTHMAAAQIPGYSRLVFFTDAAVIPYPTHEQRISQVEYITALCHAFGIEEPRVALVHFSEKANPKFLHTIGYADIIKMAQEGKWGRVIVDGPLDVRAACDAESCRVKGIKTPLEGRADALVFPDLEAANAFYKTLTYFVHAEMAAVVKGAAVPVVLPSRSDDESSKLNSLCMAAVSNLNTF